MLLWFHTFLDFAHCILVVLLNKFNIILLFSKNHGYYLYYIVS